MNSALRQKKTEKLKECYEFAGIEYKNLLRHVPTRWLSLLPAIDRMVYSWPAVKRYFLQKGKENTQKPLWDFIARDVPPDDIINDDDECKYEGISEAYLFFIHNVMQEFNVATLSLESDSSTITDIHTIMCKLLNSLKSRIKDEFYGSKTISIIKHLSIEDRNFFKSEANTFLESAVIYLEQRYNFKNDSLYNQMSALNLKDTLISWNDLSERPKKIKLDNQINIDKLYIDYCCLREVFGQLPKDSSNDKIWSYFFKKCDKNIHNDLFDLVSFVFSIPISNAFCERVFSVLDNLFSKERQRMNFDLIKAEVMIRINCDENCDNFYNFLLKPEALQLVKSVAKNTKYMWQKK